MARHGIAWYGKKNIETLSILNILKVSILEENGQHIAVITKIEIFSQLGDIRLSACSLTYRNDKLYLCGGNSGQLSNVYKNDFVKNGSVLIIDLQSTSLKDDSPADILKGKYDELIVFIKCVYFKGKMQISSPTTAWFGKNSLFIIGGSQPPLGHGGRSIIIYTSHEITVDKCDAEVCSVDPFANTSGRMVFCDGPACEREIHISCDPALAKVKKLPKIYFCPFCTHAKPS